MIYSVLLPAIRKHWRKGQRLLMYYAAFAVAMGLLRKYYRWYLLKKEHKFLPDMASKEHCGSLHDLLDARREPEIDIKFWLGHKNDPSSKRKFRILSLDGGGVRGIYSATLLRRLQKKFPNLMDQVDLIAGTSTGGLLALLLAHGYNPAQCAEFYRKVCPRIFYTNWWRKLNPFIAKYSDRHRFSVFDFLGQGLTMGDLKKHVMITAFRLDDGSIDETMRKGETHYQADGSWRPALFTNLPQHMGKVPPDLDLLVRDVAMRTTAAPTYFPTYQQYCDGAIFANNPALCAMSVAMGNYPETLNTSNVVVLSIGCGKVKRAVPFSGDEAFAPLHHKGRHDWGLIGWAKWIVDMLMDSSEFLTKDVMTMLLRNRFFYLNSVLPKVMNLDDLSTMDELIKIAEKVDLGPCLKFIEENWEARKSMASSYSTPNFQQISDDSE